MEYKNGTRYFGHFVNGGRQGIGFLEFSDTESWVYLVGNYTEDRLNGHMVRLWKNESSHLLEISTVGQNSNIDGNGFNDDSNEGGPTLDQTPLRRFHRA